MTFNIVGNGQVIYSNETSNTIDVTFSVSGQARLDLNTPGKATKSHNIGQHGGVLSIAVPAGAKIDVNANKEVQVELQLR